MWKYTELCVDVHGQMIVFDPSGCAPCDVVDKLHVEAVCPQVSKQAGTWDAVAGLYSVQDSGLVVVHHRLLDVERHLDAVSRCDRPSRVNKDRTSGYGGNGGKHSTHLYSVSCAEHNSAMLSATASSRWRDSYMTNA